MSIDPEDMSIPPISIDEPDGIGIGIAELDIGMGIDGDAIGDIECPSWAINIVPLPAQSGMLAGFPAWQQNNSTQQFLSFHVYWSHDVYGAL